MLQKKIDNIFYFLFFTFSLLGSFIGSDHLYAGTDGGITGIVLNAQGSPVSGALVQLISSNEPMEVYTSESGEYQFFPVVFGDYEVQVQLNESKVLQQKVRVASSGMEKVDLIDSSPSEIVLQVKAKRRLIQRTSAVSRTELNEKQIKHLPQGQEVNLTKLIANTSAGIVQGPSNQMFVRGNHANNQYQIDGVQLPESPSNAFGQVISPRNIDHMEVITGGFPAEYGQRLSSVVNIVSKSGSEIPSGEIELNYGSYHTSSPHLIVGGTNSLGNFRYFLSANYFTTYRGMDTPQPESLSNQKQGSTDSYHNFARGTSEFAKFDWQLDNQNKFSFINFYSTNSYQVPVFSNTWTNTNPYFSPGFLDAFGNQGEANVPTFNYLPAATNNRQSETNAYTQFVWKRILSEKSHFQLAPYYKYSLIEVNNDPSNDLFILASQPDANVASFAQNRHTNNLGLKGDYSHRLTESHLLKAGFMVQGSHSNGFISIQNRNNSPAYQDSSPTEGYFESIYIQDDYTIFKSLILNAGLRFDATQFSFSGFHPSDSYLQPRLGLNYMVTESTKIHAFYGKLFQPAPVEFIRLQYKGHSPQPLSAYDLKAQKDDFYEIGVAQQIENTHVISVNAYYKKSENILDDHQLFNTSIAQPYNFAEGYAYGVEVSIKGELFKDIQHYWNYSYQIAKGKGISGGLFTGEEASSSYQYLDHLQIHTANMGATYFKNNYWLTLQSVFGSGLRTGPNNSLNLSSHITFDTTLGYEFMGESWWSKFKLSGDILNILDNRYPITIANGFNGSHYAAGRQYFIRFAKAF